MEREIPQKINMLQRNAGRQSMIDEIWHGHNISVHVPLVGGSVATAVGNVAVGEVTKK